MNKSTLIAFAAVLGTAHADLTFVQTLDIGVSLDDLADVTIRSKNGKFRADLGVDISTIIDPVTGKVITIMHDDRTFFETKTAENKNYLAPKSAPLDFSKSEKSEIINGVEASAWTAEGGGSKFVLWMAPSTPYTEEFLQESSRLPEEFDPFQGYLNSSKLPEGLPVRLEVTDAEGAQSVITISKISIAPVESEFFSPPADYQSLQPTNINVLP